MTGDDAGDPDASSLGTCPACGEPTTMTVLLGPGEAYANPCGCRVVPEAVLETGADSDPESSSADRE